MAQGQDGNDVGNRSPQDAQQLRIDALERTVEALRAELVALRVELSGVPHVAAPPADQALAAVPADPGDPARSTRRSLLGRAGAVAAGSAAAVVASGITATPAAANDPNDLTLGAVKTTPGITAARYTGTATGPAFRFQAGPYVASAAAAGQGAALAGWVTDGLGVPYTTGVAGYSMVAGGVGVAAVADSSGAALLAQSLGGPTLRLRAGAAAPTVPPPDGSWEAGDVLRTADGHLWYCVAAGSGPASRWSRLSGGGLTLLPTPVRAYDTRDGAGPFQGDDTRTLSLSSALPIGAAGALLNVTIADTVGSGHVQVYSAAEGSPPATSNLNWFAGGQVVANSVTTAVDASRQIKITLHGGTASVIVDVFGSYT